MTNTLFYLHRKRDNLIHVNFYVDFKRRFCRFFVFSHEINSKCLKIRFSLLEYTDSLPTNVEMNRTELTKKWNELPTQDIDSPTYVFCSRNHLG